MDKKTVNKQIINGLASKGINIAEIELNHLEAFADIMYKAINVIHCCKSDSELLLCHHEWIKVGVFADEEVEECDKCRAIRWAK